MKRSLPALVIFPTRIGYAPQPPSERARHRRIELLPDNEPIRRRLAKRAYAGRSGNCGDAAETPTFAGMTPENWQSLGGGNGHDDAGTEQRISKARNPRWH